MTSWDKSVLTKINEATTVQNHPNDDAGKSFQDYPVWVVVDDDKVYLRAGKGKDSKWYKSGLKNGNRYYTEGMQGWIEMIVCLRHSDVPVEALIDYAEMLRQGDDTLLAREDLLKEQLSNLEEKRHNLDRSIKCLKHKISLYESGEIREHKSYFEEYKILDDNKE